MHNIVSIKNLTISFKNNQKVVKWKENKKNTLKQTNIDFKFATSVSSGSNNFTYSNNTVYVSSINTNKLISTRVESTYLNTKKVDTTYLKLPYSNTLLNNYIYSDMMGTLQFNKQTNKILLNKGKISR